ncbi:hypothetical protein MTO96_031372 [Rhipicephalus appendiculatus]
MSSLSRTRTMIPYSNAWKPREQSLTPVAKTSTYVWILRAPGSPDRVEVPLPQKAGQEPGTVEFLDPIDQTPREAKIYYTDYETCAILDFEVYGHRK